MKNKEINSPTLNKITIKDLTQYAAYCESIFNINIEEFLNTAIAAIKYYNGDKEARKELRSLQIIEDRWYKSLEEGSPNYELYNNLDYLPDLWGCWKIYSRNYLKKLISPNGYNGNSVISFLRPTSIVDLGCGISYTTAALKEMFPDAEVYGTNAKDSPQYVLNTHMSGEYNFKILPDTSSLKNIDLVFASEYFEHWEAPIDHLKEILKLNPKYLIIANAFSAISAGHFNEYIVNNRRVKGKQYGRIFNKHLRDSGYVNIKTTFFNNRPMIWVKEDQLKDNKLY